MPEPDTITTEDRSRWDKALADCPHPEMRLICGAPQTRARLWYPSMYLAEQLEALGCPKPLFERIAFAAGQRMFAAPDTWEVVFHTLGNYVKGLYDEPGSALAENIFQSAVERGDIVIGKDTLSVPNENLHITLEKQKKGDKSDG